VYEHPDQLISIFEYLKSIFYASSYVNLGIIRLGL
jgi:hypothetical protein